MTNYQSGKYKSLITLRNDASKNCFVALGCRKYCEKW